VATDKEVALAKEVEVALKTKIIKIKMQMHIL
jgi:hypothetical protein